MSPTDLEEIFQLHPDEPVRLTLSSGDQIDIPHAGAVHIGVTHLTIYPGLERGRLFSVDRPKYVSTVNIAMAEPVGPKVPPSSN